MSVAELKRAADRLPVQERLELLEHLQQGFRAKNPAWQAELGRRLDDCLAGKGHDEAELRAVHERLCASGR
jgi:putative addiction module component (TIGR02574 family)